MSSNPVVPRWYYNFLSILFYLLRFLSHFSLYYLPLIQLTSIFVIIRIMLIVWILYFHAITGLPLPHTHALCMTQDMVRYVKLRTGAARGLERYKIVDYVAWLVVEIFYVRERSLYSIRSLILSQWREARRRVMWQVFGVLKTVRARELRIREWQDLTTACWEWDMSISVLAKR